MSPMVVVCSNCSGQLTVPPEVLGKLVKCPLCKIVFPAPPSPNSPGPLQDEPRGENVNRNLPARIPPSRDESVPSLRKPRCDEDDDAPRRRWSRHDEDDRDRRGRRGPWHGSRDDDYNDFERLPNRGQSFIPDAEAAVIGPAVCLMMYGGLIVFIGLIFLFLSMGRNAVPGSRAENLAIAAVALCWGGFIVLGGVMMKNLKSYGLAMAAGVVVCINHPCVTIHLLLGIWVIVALNKPEVKMAFRWKANQ